MDVSYQKVTSSTETVEVSEEDIEALKEIAKASFVDRIRVIGLNSPLLNGEKQAKDLCEKYGVDTESKLSVARFLSAALSVQEDLLKQVDP